MRHVIVASLALACSGVLFGQQDLMEDKIPVWSDSSHRNQSEKVVEITEETFAEIVCKIGPGATSSIKRDDVAGEIRYQGDNELRQARNMLNGDPNQCAAAFKQLAERAAAGRTRKIFEQHALWGWALSLHNAGDLKAAAGKYAELIQKYPKTQYIYGAAEKGVDCYLAAGDGAGAKKTIDNLKSVKVDDGGRFDCLREYLTGLVDEKGGNPSGAKGTYEKVERAAGAKSPDIAAKARVGGGRCLLAAKDFAGAEKKFKEVTEGGQKGTVLLGAWNGIGDVNYAKADDEKNPTNKQALLKAALLAYLRAAIQYTPEEGESWDEKAKGMARAGLCFEQCADGLPDPQMKGEYKNRARMLYSDVLAQFGPGGPWGGLAQKRLR